jgi:SDR family mycofactocin-dependent oxidoreductase
MPMDHLLSHQEDSVQDLLAGKVALVTGAARGQGRAHSLRSAQAGADVIALDIPGPLDSLNYALATKSDLDETVRLIRAQGRRALGMAADVRSQEQLDEAVTAGIRELGKIDILVANAGIWAMSPFWKLSEHDWSEMIDVNLSGAWRSAKAVAPHMIERQTGSIVITASVLGLEAGINSAHYVAAKHGIVGLMKTIARELAPYGIRCNAICPGAVRTPMIDNQASWDVFAGGPGGTEQDMIRGGYHYHAMKDATVLPAEQIADAALYLNSDLAAAVTGVALPVDAGHLLLTGYNHAPVP